MNPYSDRDQPAGSDTMPTVQDIAPAALSSPATQVPDATESLESQLPSLNGRVNSQMAAAAMESEDGYGRFISQRFIFGTVFGAVALLIAAGFGLTAYVEHATKPKVTQGDLSNLNLKSTLTTDNQNQSLHINYNTLLDNGKSFTATGSVIIQNDRVAGFSVQGTSDSNLLVADTAAGKVGIGQAPAGPAKLQVNGDISVNGSILQTGGAYGLSSQGLTLGGVLICTSAGCKAPTVDLSSFARLAGNNSFSGINRFTAAGNVFSGDGSGIFALDAGNISSGSLSDSRLSGNVALLGNNNNFSGSNTFASQIQASGGIDASAYTANGTAGSSFSCAPGDLLRQAVIQGGIVTGGSCVSGAGVTTPTLQEVYDASSPANIVLSNASGGIEVQDAASALGADLFEVTNNSGAVKYFAVSSAGASVSGTFDATSLQQGGIGVLTQNTSFSGDISGTFDSTLIGSGAVNSSKILDGTIVNADINAAAAIAYSKLNLAGNIVNADISATANISDTKLATITSAGKVADSALSNNVALRGSDNTFTANNIFSLDTAGLAVQDAASPLGTNLFEITDHTGATKYFTVSATTLQFLGNDVCTAAGNCVGVSGGAIGGSGTAGKIAKFTGSGFTIGDSLLSDDGSTVTVSGDTSITGTLGVNTIAPTATLTVGVPTQTLILQGDSSTKLTAKSGSFTNSLVFAAPALSSKTITIPNASGTVAVSASGPLALDAAGNLTCPSCLTNNGTGGGSGVSSVNTLSGDITLAGTLHQIIITPASNTLTFSTPQDIDTTSSVDFANVNVTGQFDVNGSQISSGDLSNDSDLAKLSADQAFAGANTFSNAGNSFTGDGSGLASLNASNVSSGTLDDARLSSNVPLKNAANTFTNTNVIQATNTAAFQIQSASAADTLLTIDTTARSASGGNLVKVGNSTGTDGNTTILVVDSALSAPTSNLGALNGGLFYNTGTNHIDVIENGIVKELCNKTDLGCGASGSTTLAQAYNNGTVAADQTLALSSAKGGGLVLKDASSTVGSLFTVQDNTATTNYLNVTNAGISVSGAVVATGNINTSGGTIQTNSVSRIDNSGNLTSIGNFTASAGSTFATTGANGFTFKPGTDNALAFQIQNATGGSLLNVDSLNSNISVNGLNSGALQNWNTTSSISARYGNSVVAANGYLYSIDGGDASINATSTVQYAKINANGTVGTWSTTTNTNLPATIEGGAVVVNGYIYYIGGSTVNNGNGTATVSYARIKPDGTLSNWTTATPMPAGKTQFGYASYNGYIYVNGGFTNTGTVTSLGYFAKPNADGSITSWSNANLPASRDLHASIAANGYLYVLGGVTAASNPNFNNDVLYAQINSNGSIGSWTTTNPPGAPVIGQQSMAVSNGYIYALNGSNTSTPLNNVSYAQLNSNGSTGSWTTQASPSGLSASFFQGAAVYNGYFYIVGGFNGSVLSSVQYTSSSRVQIGGSLDLVGASGGQTLSDDFGGSLTAGNTNIVGDLQVRGNSSFGGGISLGGNLNASGQALFQNAANSTTAFQVQNAAGVNVLDVDTTNQRVAIGVEGAPTGQLYVSGYTPVFQGVNSDSNLNAPGDVFLQGRYAYVLNNTSGKLAVYDVSNPAAPTYLGINSDSNLSSPQQIYVQGRYAYITSSSNNKLAVYDVSNPSSPTYVTAVSNLNSPTGVYAQGRYLYVTNNSTNKLAVIDISNPSTPTLVTYNSDSNLSGPGKVIVVGHYAYIVNNTSGKLAVYDISNPANPVYQGVNSDSNLLAPIGLFVQGRYAYVTSQNATNHLAIYDISNPTAPTFVAVNSDSNLSGVRNVYVQGRYAYVTNQTSSKLAVYDVSNPSSPTFVAVNSDSNLSGPYPIVVSGRYAYIGNLTSSKLAVYDLGGTYTQQLEAGGAELGTLQVRGDSQFNGNVSIQGGLAVDGGGIQTTGSIGVAANATVQGYTYLSGGSNRLNQPGITGIVRNSCAGSTSYFYQLTAINANGGETASPGFAIGTNTACATLTGSNFLTISWNSVAGATAYKLYRTTSGGTPSSTGYIATTTGTSLNDTGLPANGIGAPAVDTTGQLAVSGSSLFQTPTNNINAFQVQNSSGLSILNVDTTHSTVSIASSNSTWTAVSLSQNAATTSTTGGTLAAATYFYKITAIDGAGGETIASNEQSITTTGATSTVTLSWVGASNITAYKIYRSTSTNTETYLTTTGGIANGANLNYVDTGSISPGTATPPVTGTFTYYFRGSAQEQPIQLVVGGAGKATGQVYVSGTVPTSSAGYVKTPGGPVSIASLGHYLYTSEFTVNKFEIYDASNPVAPVLIKSLALGASVGGLTAAGHYVYINVNSNLAIYDVTNPSSPNLISTTTGYGLGSMTVQGRYLYGINSNKQLVIIDIYNPVAPNAVGVLATNGGALTIQGSYVYVTGTVTANTLQIIDVSNPANPSIVGTVTTGSQPGKVKVAGRYAYVLNTVSNTMQVVDISNPTSPTVIGSVTISGTSPAGLTIQGRFAYLTNQNGGSGGLLQVIDISQPSQPSLVGTVGSNLAYPADITVIGRYAYIADFNNLAIVVFDLGGTYTQQLEAGGADLGTLQVDSNGQVVGDFNIQGGLSVGQSLQAAGNVGIGGGLNAQGSVILGAGNNLLGSPGVPTVTCQTTVSGCTSAVSWGYYVTAINSSGGETAVTNLGTITSSDGLNLSATTYNHLSWSAVSGAAGYKVYRSLVSCGACSPTPTSIGLIGSTTGTTFDDIGLAASGSVPTINTSGQLTVQGSSLFQNKTDSTTAFQIQNAAGTSNLFVADTVGGRIGIGTASPGYKLEVNGAPSGGLGLIQFVTGSTTSTSAANGSETFLQVAPSGASAAQYTGDIDLVESTSANTSGGKLIGVHGEARANIGGNVGTVIGGEFAGNNILGTVQNAFGIQASTGGSASTNAAAIDILDTISATNNTNLLIGTGTIPAGNFSIYNSSTKNNYFAGNLSIGNTVAPSGVLSISQNLGTLGNATSNYGINNSIFATGSAAATNTVAGIASNLTLQGGNANGVVWGGEYTVNNGSTSATATGAAVGVSSTVNNSNSNTITTADGFSSLASLTGSGNITAYSGLEITSPTASSTGRIGTNYGINIDPQKTAAVSGAAYGIYQSGSNDQNLFAGNTTFTGSGNGTTVAGTLFKNATNSATAFQIQSSTAADTLFTANTNTRTSGVAGNEIVVGNGTGTDTDTTILVLDAATTAPTTNLGSLNGGLFYNSGTNHIDVIENGIVKELCNKTDLGCGSAGVITTLAGAYANGSAPSDSTILLDSTRAGVLIRDNAIPLSGTLFGVQDSGGTTKYLDVTASSVTLGVNNGASSADIEAGTGGLNINTGSATNTTQIGSITAASGTQTFNIGNNAAAGSYVSNVNIGSALNASSVVIQAGTGNLSLQTQGSGILGIGTNAVAQTIKVGNGTSSTAVIVDCGTSGCSFGATATNHPTTIGSTTGTSTLTLQAGSGGVLIGTGNISNTVTIGSTSSPIAQTFNLGYNTSAGAVDAVNLGSDVSGSTTTIRGGTGGILLGPNGSGNTGVILKPVNDSTAAFQVQNASGSSLLTADTSNAQIVISSAGGTHYNDEFNTGSSPGVQWTFTNGGGAPPTASVGSGDLTVSSLGDHHNCWDASDGGVTSCTRLMETGPAGDFQADVKFDGPLPASVNQAEGILVMQDSSNFIRFEANGSPALAIHDVIGGTGAPFLASCSPAGGGSFPLYLRVIRYQNTWSLYSSSNGLNYSTCGSITQALTVSQIGLDFINNPAGAWANTSVDYFRVTNPALAVTGGINIKALNDGSLLSAQDGNGNNILTLNQADNEWNLVANSAAIFKNGNNTTTAFQVQNASGANALAIDTSIYTSLIANAGFENNTINTGWAALGTASAPARATDTIAYQGSASLKSAWGTANGNGFKYNYTFANAVYSLSFKIRLTAGTSITSSTGLVAGFHDSTDHDCTYIGAGPTTLNVTTSNGWASFSCSSVTLAAGAGYFYIYQNDSPGSARTVYLDNVDLEQTSTPTTFRETGIQLNGAVSSAVLFQNSIDSRTAFQIQNAAGTSNLFVADTTGSGQIGIGTRPTVAQLEVAGRSATQTGFVLSTTSLNSGYLTKRSNSAGTINVGDALIMNGSANAQTTTTASDTRVYGVALINSATNVWEVVISGMTTVNCNTSNGAIAIGDQLVTSTTAGQVWKDNSATTGIIGTALSTCSSNQVSVLVRPVNGQSAVRFQNLSDSSNAFEVQRAGSGALLFNIDTSGSVITFAGDTSTFVTITMTNAHFKSTQTTAPTTAAPSNCGTAPSAVVNSGSTDSAGSVTITVGSSPSGISCDTVVTFNKAYGAAPKAILLTPTMAVGSATTEYDAYVSASAAGSFTFRVVPTVSSGGEKISYYYWVVE